MEINKEKLLNEFKYITGLHAQDQLQGCISLLEENLWNLEQAVQSYFENEASSHSHNMNEKIV